MKKENSDSHLCHAPFQQMVLKPNGDVVPCCWHYGHKLGNIHNQSLDEIWNGGRMRRLRRQFLDGNPRNCQGRMSRLNCHKTWNAQLTAEIEEFQKKPPVRLDLRLGGACQLRCKMCEVWQEPNGVWREENIWTWGPKDFFPFLKEIDLLGGEPMIQGDSWRLIKEVLATNPDCRWFFVTNAHYRLSPKRWALLNSLHIRGLQVSLDSLCPETYAKIRRPGKLEVALRGLADWQEFREKKGGFPLKISFCIGRDNWRELPNFFQFCQEQNAEIELQFPWFDPSSEFSMLPLPESDKAKVATWIKENCPDHPALDPILAGLQT